MCVYIHICVCAETHINIVWPLYVYIYICTHTYVYMGAKPERDRSEGGKQRHWSPEYVRAAVIPTRPSKKL